MSFSDINDKASIILAIKEFDKIGRENFLQKYSFGRARSYMLHHEGNYYDSKAIIGAAHGYQFPEQGPLRNNAFSGGELTVKRKLEGLGFSVVLTNLTQALTDFNYWIFQANPKIYDLDGALGELKEITWLAKQHKNEIKKGDQVFIWEAGPISSIKAFAEVLHDPEVIPLPAEEYKFTIHYDKFDHDISRVRTVIKKVYAKPLLRTKIKTHPGMSKLSILKQPQGSNFRVTEEEAKILLELLNGKTLKYMPGKDDFQTAIRKLSLNKESEVSLDDVLNMIETACQKKGLILEEKWRDITEMNITKYWVNSLGGNNGH